MNRLFKENGEKVFLTDEVVGGGAESDIYNIHGDSKIVAKIYKKASSFKEKEEKLIRDVLLKANEVPSGRCAPLS